jgi:hypothetical protein
MYSGLITLLGSDADIPYIQKANQKAVRHSNIQIYLKAHLVEVDEGEHHADGTRQAPVKDSNIQKKA